VTDELAVRKIVDQIFKLRVAAALRAFDERISSESDDVWHAIKAARAAVAGLSPEGEEVVEQEIQERKRMQRTNPTWQEHLNGG
jgi:hypothetical protein